MPYTGPTLITYEEWWKWERKRLKAGKVPSKRTFVPHCLYCKQDHDFGYPHTCTQAEGKTGVGDPFALCERVKISY